MGLNPLGLVSSIFSSVWQKKQNDEAMRVQIAENQKNRDFNAAMMDKANMWNLSMWNRNNDYNSPSNQIMRLKQAGINPNLFYGNGGSMSMSSPVASSPSASSSGSVSPMSPVGFDLQNALTMAQIRNVNADTENKQAATDKTRGEASIVWSDAKVRDALNKGSLEIQGVTIDLSRANKNLSDWQTRVLAKTLDRMEVEIQQGRATVDNLVASTSSINADVVYKKLQNYYASDMFESSIREISSRIHVNYSQAKAVVMNAITNRFVGESTVSLNASTARLNDANASHIAKIDSKGGLTDLQAAFQTLLNEKQGIENRGLDLSTPNLRKDSSAEGVYRMFGNFGWLLGQAGRVLGGIRL